MDENPPPPPPERIDPLGPMRAIYEQQRPGPAVLAGTAGAIVAGALWAVVLGYGEFPSATPCLG